MKTVEPEGEESKSREQEPVAAPETTPADDYPDPNFTIEASGGPSDGTHVGPPKSG